MTRNLTKAGPFGPTLQLKATTSFISLLFSFSEKFTKPCVHFFTAEQQLFNPAGYV